MIDCVYIYILDDYRIILVYDCKKGSIDSDGILCDKYGEPMVNLGWTIRSLEACQDLTAMLAYVMLRDGHEESQKGDHSRCAMLEMLLPEHALTLLMIFDVFFQTRCALQKTIKAQYNGFAVT